MKMTIVKNNNLSPIGKIELNESIQAGMVVSLTPVGYMNGTEFVPTHFSFNGEVVKRQYKKSKKNRQLKKVEVQEEVMAGV